MNHPSSGTSSWANHSLPDAALLQLLRGPVPEASPQQSPAPFTRLWGYPGSPGVGGL